MVDNFWNFALHTLKNNAELDYISSKEKEVNSIEVKLGKQGNGLVLVSAEKNDRLVVGKIKV